MKGKIKRIMKGILCFVLIAGGFLLMCSETLPGDYDKSALAMVAQEALGLGLLGLGFMIAGKLERR